MAKIVPFRGLRYNQEKIGDPAQVVAPPYDVISPELQEELYERSPYNVVRLILGRTSEEDSEGDNRYTRAAEHFESWQREGVLRRDDAPSIYLYDQEYPGADGEPVVRKGISGRDQTGRWLSPLEEIEALRRRVRWLAQLND